MAPVVEFTDLTAPYQEDRRQRRPQAQDKQAISSMHMVSDAVPKASVGETLSKVDFDPASKSSESRFATRIPGTEGEARPRSPTAAGRVRGETQGAPGLS